MNINDYSDIADLYDIYVPATFDIPFFVEETKRATGEVLELMAGTGRVSIPMLEAGVRLTCVDSSEEMNAILRDKLERRGLRADVYTQDVCELDLGKQFAMVVIPFHSFAHIVSPADQRKALERIRQHLVPGGTFICTLANPALRQKAVDGQLRLFREYALPDAQGTLLLWILEKHSADDDRVVEAYQFYEEYDRHGTLQRKRLMELRFRLSTRQEFEALAAAAGFGVQAVFGDYSHGEFKDDSPFMIWRLV